MKLPEYEPCAFLILTSSIFPANASVGDDVSLASDAAVLKFGADSEVTITHVHDTGILINDARELRFRDGDLKILSSTDGQLDIDADTELELTAPTVQMNVTTADLNGNLDVSGNTTLPLLGIAKALLMPINCVSSLLTPVHLPFSFIDPVFTVGYISCLTSM